MSSAKFISSFICFSLKTVSMTFPNKFLLLSVITEFPPIKQRNDSRKESGSFFLVLLQAFSSSSHSRVFQMWQKSLISDVLTQVEALYNIPNSFSLVLLSILSYLKLSFNPILRGIFKAEIEIPTTCVHCLFSGSFSKNSKRWQFVT